MNILFVLIPISLVLLLVIIATFIWAVRRGQFEDLDTPAIDILSDDAPPPGHFGEVTPAGSASTADRDAD
ncbi:cbb3-type cytochrome oxidase assembly protein CcoS [Luteimonas dalianensis]|uniref:cbb3-type cytochrome oxidase assembly protein CcoS n=1 Tax=Luteimonas dalianensis TaxID=1148196 RepID=UPI003BF11304